jgi:hypothetical protein
MKGNPRLIAKSPTVKPSPATMPGCVVVREFDDEYVVHNAQVNLDTGKVEGYFWGCYVKKDRPDALQRAVLKFVEKVIAWHGLRDEFPPKED